MLGRGPGLGSTTTWGLVGLRLVVLWLLVGSASGVRCEPAPAPPSAPAPGDVLTLDQAIALALQGNRQVRNSRLEVGKAQNELAAARTRRLPAVDLGLQSSELLTPVDFSFPQGAFGTFPGVGPIPARDIDVSSGRTLTTYLTTTITQPLTQLRRIRLGVQLKAAGVGSAREGERAQQQTVAVQVKQVYYGLLQAQSGVQAAEESLRFLTELEREVGEAVALQAALQTDLLDARARRAKQEYDLLSLKNNLANGKEQLNLLLGRDLRTPFQVAPLAPTVPDPGNLVALQTRALQQRPELLQSELRVKQADLDRRMKQTESVPDVSFGLFLVTQTNIDILPQQLLSVGIKLSWEPWDWGRKRAEAEEKRRILEQTRNARQDTEAQVLSDVNTQFRKLQEARELVRVTEAAQTAAREKVRVTRNRYAEKAVLLKDLLEAQANLADANYQQQQALLNLASTQANLERAIGIGVP